MIQKQTALDGHNNKGEHTMKQAIHCTVAGGSGEGKTTLIKLFAEAAEAEGWVCVNLGDLVAHTDAFIEAHKKEHDKVIFFTESSSTVIPSL